MKKYLIAAIMTFIGWSVLRSEGINSPTYGDIPIAADYGGVDIATSSFYVGLTTVPTGIGNQGVDYTDFYISTTSRNGLWSKQKWRVYGVIFSTGICSNNDFIAVHVSSAGAATSREVTRFYNNIAVSTTATGSAGLSCGGAQWLRWPIRAYGNLFYGVNFPTGGGGALPLNPFNQVNLLFWKEETNR